MTHRIALALALCLLTHAAASQARADCAPPRVLFVVDRSSSMLERLPAGGTKWDAAGAALQRVAGDLEGAVDLGLQVFPFPDRCAPGAVTVEVGPHPAHTLVYGLGGPPPSAGSFTPMAETLDVIAAYAPMLDPAVDSHVVLITDGWQWCSPHDPSTRFTPVTSVERLGDLGLTIHVIGFGVGVDALTLNRAALAGGTALPGCDPSLADPMAPNHCYLQAHDATDLDRALDGIARSITEETCDGWDNDCDGATDEGFDRDGDGYTTCGTVPGVPGAVDSSRRDCDDEAATTFPGAGEACNGSDDDCDGSVDPGCACDDGDRRPCGVATAGCALGTQTCAGGVWTACEGMTVPQPEDCDGYDDDCDGTTDEDAECGAGHGCVEGLCEPLVPSTPVDPVARPALRPTTPRDTVPPSAAGCACRAAQGTTSASGVTGGALLALLLGWRRRTLS